MDNAKTSAYSRMRDVSLARCSSVISVPIWILLRMSWTLASLNGSVARIVLLVPRSSLNSAALTSPITWTSAVSGLSAVSSTLSFAIVLISSSLLRSFFIRTSDVTSDLNCSSVPAILWSTCRISLTAFRRRWSAHLSASSSSRWRRKSAAAAFGSSGIEPSLALERCAAAMVSFQRRFAVCRSCFARCCQSSGRVLLERSTFSCTSSGSFSVSGMGSMERYSANLVSAHVPWDA
ncbi:hypothetical protein B0H10DRAFT_881980 [Mycena sp. CBHHK59/15]|nr:hypothetical protein B0H10DRAFT_881980 [Mycena sp. CBHHK59/15]